MRGGSRFRGFLQPTMACHSLAGLSAVCHVTFLGTLLLNIKRNRWRLYRGREARRIEELLRSVWTHFLFWAVAPSLSPLRHLSHSRPWQLDTLTAAAEWQLICTNFKPYKSTCHNKSIKEPGPSRYFGSGGGRRKKKKNSASSSSSSSLLSALSEQENRKRQESKANMNLFFFFV